MADMNAALKADGQRTLIAGNRSALRNAPELESGVTANLWVNTFTSNADGSLGYNLEGDKPLGQPLTTVCVAGKFTNIKLYDARKPGIRPETKRGAAFNKVMAEYEVNTTRPMLQADAIAIAPDGKTRIGNGITLFYNTRLHGAYLVVNYPDGTAADILMMTNTDYTPTALARLDAAAKK